MLTKAYYQLSQLFIAASKDAALQFRKCFYAKKKHHNLQKEA